MTTPTAHVLFVDDDPNILRGLRRMLRSMQSQWTMDFVPSGQEALELLAQRPVDVLLSDMRMPRMDGATLLHEVRRRHPGVIRIILSGHSDSNLILHSLGATHQFLVKPCDPDRLKVTIERALALKRHALSPALRQTVTRLDTLPVTPADHQELVQAIIAPDVSLQRIAQIVSREVGMTAKIMQLVNSSFFGIAHRVGTAAHAVALLGHDVIRTLVLGTQVFSRDYLDASPEFDAAGFRRHSQQVAALASRLAGQMGCDQHLIDLCYLSGMLHDVGRLLLAAEQAPLFADCLRRARTEHVALDTVEQEILGVSHAALGAALLRVWGFGDPVTEAVEHHHQPRRGGRAEASPLAFMHVADALLSQTGRFPHAPDEPYLAELGWTALLPAWQTLAQEMRRREPARAARVA